MSAHRITMRYFLATGIAPCPHPPQRHLDGYSCIGFSSVMGETRRQRMKRYQKAGIAVPDLGETVFLRHKQFGRISVFVYGAFNAFILIVAKSQRNAYLLGNSLRAALSCFYGHSPTEHPSGYLLELSRPPSPHMSDRDLAILINPHLRSATDGELLPYMEPQCGPGIDHVELEQGCALVRNALSSRFVLDALLHLDHSRTLVWGFMNGSFYDSHYSPDRKALSRYSLERAYLENRFRYDSAFVSAFRGLESLLGKPGFSESQIPDILLKTDTQFSTSFAKRRHRSRFEVFSSRKKRWTYKELIAYYLKLRNAVSAHGNPKPRYIVMEDQVLEIQSLLQRMLAYILVPRKKEERTKQ